VSEPAASSAPADSILVEFPAREGYRSVGRLVLGGLASRFELPVDRVEDLLLAVESLLHGVAGDTVTLEVEAGDDGLRVRMGPFADGGVGDPAVARVVTKLVDEARETTSENGDGAFAELLVSAARHGRDG
jgi:anti-sigma regulatory factor (Ser/Thr protein kinase)